MKTNEKYVFVRRSPMDIEIAKYRFEDLENPQWGDMAGGLQVSLPQSYIQGYVNCRGMIEGEIAHSGIHGSCPHRIKVCVVKVDNEPEIIEELTKLAGPQPKKFSSKRKRWCINDMKEILSNVNRPLKRSELLAELEERGHTDTAMADAIKKHSDSFSISRCPDDKRQFQYKLKK